MSTIILGIESSCDDTSAAVIKDGYLLSNVVASQAVHEAYGGVVPELASRAHQQNIVPVVHEALKRAGVTKEELSAVAFTRGPGLMGSLLVGVSFAKGFARSLGIPMIDVNHLNGHVLAHFIKAEGEENVRIAYGTIVNDIKEVSKSYKEAKLALDVGKIFFDEKEVIAYSALGIGRLIYQLPVNLCKIFIEEIFGDNVPMDLDEETLNTLNKFFENNLNVSETSRQLFVHRNTLVYRIEKIQKSTGLDLRSFDDALTFKIALMVVNYMKYLDNQEY